MDTLQEKIIYISDSPVSALEQVDLIFNSVNWSNQLNCKVAKYKCKC